MTSVRIMKMPRSHTRIAYENGAILALLDQVVDGCLRDERLLYQVLQIAVFR